jgi:hypothetical protein
MPRARALQGTTAKWAYREIVQPKVTVIAMPSRRSLTGGRATP